MRDVLKSLDGAWGVAMRDPNALSKFDLSIRGFWNSFFAAVLAAPFWLWFSLSQHARLVDSVAASFPDLSPPSLKLFLLTEGAAYGFSWVLFALLLIPIANILQVKKRYAAYIIVHNWAMLLVYFLLATPSIALYNLSLIGAETKNFLDLTTLFLELAYMWIIARTVLGVSVSSAIAIVIFDVLLSIFISLSAQSFYLL